MGDDATPVGEAADGQPQPTDPARRTPERRPSAASASIHSLDKRWQAASRYDRRARVTFVDHLTPTGTVNVGFEVDGGDFLFEPGQFVGIATHIGVSYRRSPYCVMSPPRGDCSFELLVRVVAEGPMSQYLASRQPGDVIAFRGPTGRSMMPPTDSELILLATGVGIAPFFSLAKHLLAGGFSQPIHLYWGLRLVEDICLTEPLDDLAAKYPNFRYDISLSQPPPGWTGLRGRITESVPERLGTLGGKLFYLCGNGAMTEEFGAVLSDLGVYHTAIYEEPYFNRRHRPEPEVLDAIRRRFVARDLFSAFAQGEELFPLEAPVGARSRRRRAQIGDRGGEGDGETR